MGCFQDLCNKTAIFSPESGYFTGTLLILVTRVHEFGKYGHIFNFYDSSTQPNNKTYVLTPHIQASFMSFLEEL